MSFVDRISSALRFLTPAQQRMAVPAASEAAVVAIAARMGVHLPRSTS